MSEHEKQPGAKRVDLAVDGERLLIQARESVRGTAAETLVKDGPLRLVLLALRAGASIAEHRAPGPVSLHVLKGAAVFGVGETQHSVADGGVLVLAANEVHSVLAESDALILLTIAMPA